MVCIMVNFVFSFKLSFKLYICHVVLKCFIIGGCRSRVQGWKLSVKKPVQVFGNLE